MQIGRATIENPTKVLQKIKTRSTIQSRNSTSEYLHIEIKIIHTYASVCLLYHLQYPYCGNCPSIDKWIKKMYVSKQNGILASHKK